MLLRARGSVSSVRPRFPGRCHLAGLQPDQEEVGRVEEVTDEPLYRDRVCGIDIGKAGMVATIRVPSERNPVRRAAARASWASTLGSLSPAIRWCMMSRPVTPCRSVTRRRA